jgi:hypothetical protein
MRQTKMLSDFNLTSNSAYLRGFLLFFILVLVSAGIATEVIDLDPVNEEKETEDRQIEVDEIQKSIGAGNLGSRTFYTVVLENGTEIETGSYTQHHPLCDMETPPEDVDCSEDGETDYDPGAREVEQVYEQNKDKEIERESYWHISFEDLCFRNNGSIDLYQC